MHDVLDTPNPSSRRRPGPGAFAPDQHPKVTRPRPTPRRRDIAEKLTYYKAMTHEHL
jgi:hypothetical protein